MSAKDKREKERLEGINRRKKEVVEAAKTVFSEKSIEKATMQDIALKAEVGVASVYRYYATKLDLVMEVALDYWENDFSYEPALLVGTGIEQTSQMMDHLLSKLKSHPTMLVFMEQFDAYISSCEKEQVPLESYEKMITNNNALITGIIEKG
ncbi:MAG: TetR/AcrR family transcriptional regulator, partial [Vallitaleaceae bacterium]|nr:TetR/AcrR family transcriptional regulator [Vallitaleaceae bacterium]